MSVGPDTSSTSTKKRRGSPPGEAAGELVSTGSANALRWTTSTQEVIRILGRKWLVSVLRELQSGPRRHYQLRHGIKGVSAKVLTDTLRCLERDGMVERGLIEEEHGELAIAYRLTDLGRSLFEVLDMLRDWGDAHLPGVLQSRRSRGSQVT